MPTYVGIDIGRVSVKCAAVRSAYRKTQLIGVSTVHLGPDADIVQAIREAVRGVLGERHGDGMATSLPGAKAVMHTLELPAAATRQMREILPFELDAQIPFDIDGAVFDHHILPSTSKDIANVLVAVARIEDVKERIDWIAQATGVEPERIDVGGAPIVNVLPLALTSSLVDTVAIVDLGSESSDVVLVHQGEVYFSRTISFGTKGLPETAARLGRELRLTMSAFRASQGLEVKHVYLCGGGAFVSGAEHFLSAELELPVSFMFSAWAQLYAKGKEQDTLSKALAIVTKEVLSEETGDAARAQELLAKQTTIADEDPLPHADAFDVLNRISDVVPQSMTHDIEEFDFQKNHVIIHGVVGSTRDAESIATSLKTDRCFSDVKITRTSQVVGGDRQKYILEFDLKCPEDQKTKKKEPSAASSATAAPSSTQGGK